MKLPRGFGKNYFSLTAITATVNQLSLNANATRVQKFHTPLSFEGSEEEVLEELELEESCTLQLSLKPCHCNCHFIKRTRKTLRNHPRQNLFIDYHRTINSTISPPYSIFYFI